MYLTGKSESIFVVTMIMLMISFLAVSSRCFVRLKLLKVFGWDDAIMVFAMVLNILLCCSALIGAAHGIGQRSTDIRPPDVEKALMYFWIYQVAYAWTCVAGKISIVMTLLRVAVKRIHKIILGLVILVTVLIGLGSWLIIMLECRPVSRFWNSNQGGQCLGADVVPVMGYIYSVLAAMCDFTIGIIPAFILRDVQMNRRTKLALICALGLGCIASCAVLVRIPFLYGYKSEEFLYSTAEIMIWSTIEASLGITAGSLSTLRPFLRFIQNGSHSISQASWQGNNIRIDKVKHEVPVQSSRSLEVRRPDFYSGISGIIITNDINMASRKQYHHLEKKNGSQKVSHHDRWNFHDGAGIDTPISKLPQ